MFLFLYTATTTKKKTYQLRWYGCQRDVVKESLRKWKKESLVIENVEYRNVNWALEMPHDWIEDLDPIGKCNKEKALQPLPKHCKSRR